jgi:NADH:ubiquinone oxidoreductase subunit 3 (subunit A)
LLRSRPAGELLDVHYRRTQLLHGARAAKVQDLLAPGYRLGHPGEPEEPGEQPSPDWTRYVSTVVFYVFLLFLLLLLWILLLLPWIVT